MITQEQVSIQQANIDIQNTEFWNELCGTWLAHSAGVTDAAPESLRRFDAAYLAMYPYLRAYVANEPLSNKKLLEIGLGYGTLGQLLADHGSDYHGLDIADGPVAMMRHRLQNLGIGGTEQHVRVGSALAIPHEDGNFDYVYSIGCLHHTGDLTRAVDEVFRVLKPGGKAIVMLYNRRSLRQLAAGLMFRLAGSQKGDDSARRLRALYDSSTAGDAAPHTDYVSTSEARELFKSFSHVGIDIQNFDRSIKGRRVIPRHLLLNNVARIWGLDLYITAIK
jgi:ubiquinone/menaquinone biosynthesis C-methylase UbiE